MISLSEYILESSANVTTAWMEKMYAEFNNTLFDGKLPKCLLEAKKLKNKMLGLFSFKEKIWLRNPRQMNGGKKYRIYKYSDKRTPINDIQELMPTISMNNDGSFRDETAMESTLVHEMIHFYTYKDGWAPAMAHGKEFKTLCIIIGNRAEKAYGKKLDLSVYADCENFTLSDEASKKEVAKLKKQGVSIIIVETNNIKYPTRIVFTTNSSFDKIIEQIKDSHKMQANAKLEKIYVLRDATEIAAPSFFNTIVKSRTYGAFYIPSNIPEIWDKLLVDPNLETLYDAKNEVLESKLKNVFRKIKKVITALFVNSGENLSANDIEKIGVIEPIDVEEDA